MSVTPINLRTLSNLAHKMIDLGIDYGLGSKASMSAKPEDIKAIDCSGFSRYLIYHATEPNLTIPDGSFNQREWCEKQGLKKIPAYPQVAREWTGSESSKLYLCFIDPNPIGHVFFVVANKTENGIVAMTFESFGGNGPGSRSWNHRPLPQETGHVFEWSHTWK